MGGHQASKEETNMQSTNPIFQRSPEFNGSAAARPTSGGAYPGYQQPASDPSTWGTGNPTTTDQSTGRMTIDSVVQATGLSLLLVLVTAAATWFYIGDVTTAQASDANLAKLTTALLLGSAVAFGLSLVNSFKRVISPALVLAFAAAEGVALGALSKFFDVRFGDGIVTQAVVGTFAAFAGTLAAYKFFNISVGQRFRTFVVAAMFGMVALGLMEMALSFFGNSIGFFGFGGLGLLFAVAGLVLGVFMLILDFDFVERGIAAGLPQRESWRAAFGLTVSLVWIYTNLLRILAIMRGD
ncbi:MAG: Bax inhibitor-1/YccA family protein [Nocardioides sp.]